MKPEIGLAFASLALALMFAFYIISLFIVFTKEIGIGTAEILLLSQQKIFIGTTVLGLPSIGLSITTFILGKRNALKLVSIVLMIQGIVMIGGMLTALSISNGFIEEYKKLQIEYVPQLFILGSIVPLGLGIRLFMLKPEKRSRFFTT
ncbi:MAG: hypothetical protein QW416_03185 [Candidatus Nitrosocaldaceae archaeon]